MMKLVLKDQEFVIHVLLTSNFYTVDLVNATCDELVPQSFMPFVYMMIATVMFHNGFEAGFGFGRNS